MNILGIGNSIQMLRKPHIRAFIYSCHGAGVSFRHVIMKPKAKPQEDQMEPLSARKKLNTLQGRKNRDFFKCYGKSEVVHLKLTQYCKSTTVKENCH